MIIDINGVVTGVLVHAITVTGRFLYSPAMALRNRRSERDMEIARWFQTYELPGPGPALPMLSSELAEQLANTLHGNEAQAVLQELLAARLTDASESDVRQVRTVWDGTLALFAPEIMGLSGILFDFYDAKIGEMVARLEARGHSYLAQIREESNNIRVIAVLNAIERHTASLSARSAVRDEDSFIPRYRRQVIDQHGKIEPPDFERRQRIPINDIYVSPSIFELDDSEQWTSLRQLSLKGLSNEIDRSVLLGDPGAGKTTAANVLVHNFASSDAESIPFLVTLRDFAAQDPPTRSVVRHIEHSLETFYQCPAPAGYVDWLLLTGQALMIFDGLDELLDTSRRAAVSTRIERFCTEYPLAKVLVTSRLVGYNEARLDDRQFACYRLSEFNDKQVGQYVNKWFAQEGKIGDARRWANSFLKESASVLDLRANPLLLSLLCILYRGEGSLPRKRAEVYGQCSKLLFDKWDARRKIHHDLMAGHLIESTIRYLALWLFTREEVQPVVTERDLVTEATSFLHGRGFESEIDARMAAIEFVEFCRGRMWVFSDAGTTATGESLYGFTHRTFMEYFAAARLAADSDSPEQLAKALVPYIARRTWDVVAELAIQIKDHTSTDGARRIYTTLLDGRRRSAESRSNIVDFLAMSLRSVDPSPQVVRRVTTPTLDQLFSEGNRRESVPATRARAWPRTLSNLLTCGHPCRETVADEITAVIAARVQSDDFIMRLAGLRFAVWFPHALPSNYANENNLEWAFWDERRSQIVHSHATVIVAAAENDGGMRKVAIENGFISITQALAMPGALLTLFESYDTAPCPVSWPPYLERTFRAFVKGWPAIGSDDVVSDLSAIGCYLLKHPGIPWIRGTVGDWDDVTKGDNSDRALSYELRQVSQAEFLGAAAILSILSEDRWMSDKIHGQALGPFEAFYPYLVYRRGHTKISLPHLPISEEFNRLFRDWAHGSINFVGHR